MTNVLCGSRLVMAAARDGLLPTKLASRSQQTGAPVAALLALAGAYVLMIAMIAALGLDETDVVALTTAIFMIVYLATAVAVLRDRPDRALSTCAVVTGASAVCMLPFTGLGLPIAGAVTLTIVVVLAANRVARRAETGRYKRLARQGVFPRPS